MKLPRMCKVIVTNETYAPQSKGKNTYGEGGLPLVTLVTRWSCQGCCQGCSAVHTTNASQTSTQLVCAILEQDAQFGHIQTCLYSRPLVIGPLKKYVMTMDATMTIRISLSLTIFQIS